MPVHNFQAPRGEIARITVGSKALLGNLLGDPAERSVWVYLPEGYGDSKEEYPLFVDLAGYTGSGPKHLAWTLFGESLPQRADRLVAEGKMGPAVFAFPDCFTSLGGNQYIDSVAMGLWEVFLVEEMIPALEREFRIRRGREHRALFGKSSGGYGAVVHAMKHADAWNAVACHSGDMAFDLVYRVEFPAALDRLAAFGHDTIAFVNHMKKARKVDGGDLTALMALAMAATYDPDPEAPFGARLPVDPETCEMDEERWARWLEHDPITMVRKPERQENLRRLAGLYIDCGSRDQYRLHYGNRVFVRELKRAGIPHRYEEFDDNHSDVNYRMDESLPFLWKAITGG
ncbi:MAG: enterochelin esterase [Candidatus Eisenbacteria bacterium]|nr:enterochelin esterase [Candidatus Eisenbacteria bacterium]